MQDGAPRGLQHLLPGIALGVLLGCTHAAAEILLAGWYGIQLRGTDLLGLELGYAGLGAAYGAAGGLLAGLLSLVPGCGAWIAGSGLPAALLGGYAAHEAMVFVQRGAGGLLAAVWLAVAAAALLRLLLAPPGRGRLVLAFAAVCLAARAAPLHAGELPRVAAAERASFGLWLALPPAVLAAALFWPARRRAAPWRSSALLASAAGFLVLPWLLWGSVLPRPLRWHVHREPLSLAPALQPAAPNVLLVVLDTVRADHMDLFGYERATMPELRRFAQEECQVAIRSMATAPSSLPSHASLFTGLYSSQHGAHKPFLHDPDPPEYAYFLRDDVLTLAEALSYLGYDTGGICGNFGVLASYGLPRGFQYYDVAPGAPLLASSYCLLRAQRYFGKPPAAVLDHLLPGRLARNSVLFTPREPPYRRATEITTEAVRWLAESRRPFFLFLNYFDAHDPYLPEPAFDGCYVPEPPGISWVGFPKADYRDLLRGRKTLPPEELEYLKGQYDAELRSVDRECRRLFEELKRLGQWDDTLVVVVSDHGESFLEHGLLRHSTSLYEPQIGVPLLVKLPRSAAGPLPDSAQRMQFVDVLPTVLELVGGTVPEGLDGSPWARGRDWSMAEVFCHEPHIPRLRREMCAVEIDAYKYIHSTTGEEEVYHFRNDPLERRNLLGTQPDLEQRARDLVRRRNERIVETVRQHATDPETLQALKELGYISDH